MNIVVPIKFVPDPVEDLEIDSSTGLLDRSFLRLIPNELDEHALEEALLLKERHGGSVAVLAVNTGDVDETLYTAVAKGADRVIKISGEGFDQGITNRRHAAILHGVLADQQSDLILTGTQAIDDLDGFVGSFLAERLNRPYVGYVTKVQITNGHVLVQKEFPGGLNAEITVACPAVIGIQAAEKPPRYVVTSKVMEAMKTAQIEELEAPAVDVVAETSPASMSLPESSTHAEMIEGDVAAVAASLAKLLRERGLVA